MLIDKSGYRLIFTIAVISFMSACAKQPTIQTGSDAEVIGDNLYKVENARANAVFINPDADYSQYKKILVMPLVLDDVKIVQPSSSRPSRKWALTDSDKEKLKKSYQESMASQLPKGGAYELATEPGEDVLILEAHLVAIAPTAPKDDFRSRPIGRSRIITEGGGALTLAVSLNDSQSGTPLAQFIDQRKGSTLSGSNTRVSNLAEVKRMFNYWAASIRDGLGKIVSLKHQ